MNVDEAVDIVANYLTGGPADRQQLTDACAAVNADEKYRRFFSREFGLERRSETPCRQFEAYVAEFAGMSPAQREREMPESLKHVQQCANCRRLYWEVREPWISQARAAVAAKGRQVVRTLAEGIRLAIGRAGDIVEYGLGPPSVLCPVIASTTGERLLSFAVAGPTESEAEERVWTLEDEVPGAGDAGSETYKVTITIRVRRAAQGKALVFCLVEGLPPGDLSRMYLVISGRKASGAKAVKGASFRFKQKLADYNDRAVEVPLGDYAICIEPEGSQPSHAWEIPLSLGSGG